MLLAACGTELNSVRPAAAFVAIVFSAQSMFCYGRPVPGTAPPTCCPFFADKHSLSGATAPVTLLEFLQGQDRPTGPVRRPLLEIGKIVSETPATPIWMKVPKIAGLVYYRLSHYLSWHFCRVRCARSSVLMPDVLGDGFILEGQFVAINGGFLPLGG